MARVGTLVKVDAAHVRVVSLGAGDVYKRIIPADSYNKARVVFGAVTDVLANGNDAAIVAIEYEISSYSDVDAKIVTLREDDDAAIFPAQPEEVRTYFNEVSEAQVRKVAAKNRELIEAKRRLEAVQRVLSSELRAPETAAIEQ